MWQDGSATQWRRVSASVTGPAYSQTKANQIRRRFIRSDGNKLSESPTGKQAKVREAALLVNRLASVRAGPGATGRSPVLYDIRAGGRGTGP